MAGTWMKRTFVAVAAIGTGLATGCSTMSNTGKGALGGGAIGAGVGTLVGAATGNPRTGAVVGTALGAGIGSVIGSEQDAKEKERADEVRLAEAQAAANGPGPRGPLSLDDVVQMSKPNPSTGAKVSDDTIIDYIRSTNSRFDLSPGDIQYLTTAGVSDRVVREMVNSRTRTAIATQPRTVIVRDPAPATVIYERPYYARPYYYAPPPPIGVGFSYVRVR